MKDAFKRELLRAVDRAAEQVAKGNGRKTTPETQPAGSIRKTTPEAQHVKPSSTRSTLTVPGSPPPPPPPLLPQGIVPQPPGSPGKAGKRSSSLENRKRESSLPLIRKTPPSASLGRLRESSVPAAEKTPASASLGRLRESSVPAAERQSSSRSSGTRTLSGRRVKIV